MRRPRRRQVEEAELDITSFMNLMIVLVPVLLLSLVFSQVRILNLQLPVSASSSNSESLEKDEEQLLELVINKEGLSLNYPSGILLKNFPKISNSDSDSNGDNGNNSSTAYDFGNLALFLQDLKLTFQQKNIEKNDIVLLLSSDINYQVIVTAMDTVRSFKAVVAANLVDAELFPNISLGDAPETGDLTSTDKVTP